MLSNHRSVLDTYIHVASHQVNKELSAVMQKTLQLSRKHHAPLNFINLHTLTL